MKSSQGLIALVSWLVLAMSSQVTARPNLPKLGLTSVQVESIQPLPLGVDQKHRFRTVASYENGTSFNYSGRVVWSSLTPEVATISKDGWVEGLKAGKAVIQAYLDQWGMTQTLEFDVVKKDIEIYIHAPMNWNKAHIWYWYLDGSAHVSGNDSNGNPLPSVMPRSLGSWPGPMMKAVPDMPGWFSAKLPRYDDATEFPGKNLKSQPIRIVFSNPDLGEQTRDMLHYDGCFLSYNKYLGDPANKVIDGRWDSPNNCPAFERNIQVVAEAPGGPIFNQKTFIDLALIGDDLVDGNYSLSGLPAKDSDFKFPQGEALILGEQLAQEESITLCLKAEGRSKTESQRCFFYWEGDASKFKQLGADYSANETTFAIWSPDRNTVELWLDGETIPMGYIGNAVDMPGVYAVTVPGDHKLKPYNFVLDGATVRDPYGSMVEPATDYNIVMDLDSITPEGGWVPTPRLLKREDAIIYEMSIRDFTWAANSGVSQEKRGRFLGSVEPGSYLNKGRAGADPSITTGIDHLKEMGVTHVQLLPAFDSATCSAKDDQNFDGCYNWGYDPENFNIPEERYSQFPNDPEARVREFQTMVNEFHKAGIFVIMDVVYNHTWVRPWRESDEGEKVFGDITGKYFLQDAEGFGYQLTGTGNTIDASRDPMVDKFIRESLEFWVETYNVDGFRFDMAGVFDYSKITDWMAYLEKKFPEKKLINYGEPWTALEDPDYDHFRLSNIDRMYASDGTFAHFGGFNFPFREAIKGANDWGGGGGYAFNDTYNITTVMNGIRGSVGQNDIFQSAFAGDPVQTINYASVHDNLTLFDKIEAWAGLQDFYVSMEYKARISGFANSVVLFSQGLPMLHSGVELLRSKDGIHDSYNAPDSINQIDWQRKKDFWGTYDYYRHLTNTRNRFEGLRLGTADEINRAVRTYYKGNGLIETFIGRDGKDRKELLILFNSGPDQYYNLPSGEWTVAVENATSTRDRKVSGGIMIGGTAATLLYR